MQLDETIDAQNIYENQPELIQANRTKRFLNLLIDIGFFYLLVFVFFLILFSINLELANKITNINPMLDRIYTALLLAIYFSLFEAITKGRTLGKLITGTRAVNDDGSELTFKKAFQRGFIRIIPFEIISGIVHNPPSPWHDSWSETQVIDLKKSQF